MRGLPVGLRVGLGGLVVMVAACSLGPLVLPAAPPADPVRCGLLAPGTTVVAVTLADGRSFAAPAPQWDPRTHSLGQGSRRLEIDASQIVEVRHGRFLLGSDRFGRDLSHELLRGGLVSLSIAAVALVLSLGLGLLVGLLAASSGPLVDALLMRTVDAALSFPLLFLMILIAATFQPGPVALVLLLGCTTWMGLSRLVRGEILSLRTRPFVLAARAAGSRWPTVWRRHYLPNISGPVAQDTALRMGDLIIAEATLSYLGLGVPPGIPTWGSMVAEGQRVLTEGWWLATLPGVAIASLVISLALVGDGLQGLFEES